mmetsp:Transcript_5279/g.8529  ORF Transcript_5279/g.8529 Transcript_5279/m.8529 type:complete len:322 (+) Transcript_5279:3-968(+)
MYTACLAYFVIVCLLSGAAWDNEVAPSASLDITYANLCSVGGRLLLLTVVISSVFNYGTTVLVMLGFYILWIAVWMTLQGCSVRWVMVLRLGMGCGSYALHFGCVVFFGGFAVGSWCAAVLVASLWALADKFKRRAALAASEIPTVMSRLSQIQARLSLFGDAISMPVNVDASPCGAASQLLDFEAGLPVERLRRSFLVRRQMWRAELYNIREYETLVRLSAELEKAIAIPPPRALLQKMFRKIPIPGRQSGLPQTLTGEIVSYLVADEWSCVAFSLPQNENFKHLPDWQFRAISEAELIPSCFQTGAMLFPQGPPPQIEM